MALAVSAVLHVAILTWLVSEPIPQYAVPEPAIPPIDAQIVQLPEPSPPPETIIPPKLAHRTLVVTPAAQPQRPPSPAPPTPPKPAPLAPRPAPPLPTPTKPETPKALPLPIKAATPPAPLSPVALAIPLVAPQPKPAPPAPRPAVAASPAPTASQLNIRKSIMDAPANVATLPLAPRSPPAGPSAALVGAINPQGASTGSRLSGLTPFPYGAMPGGGGGLRGTLVGCANAESVRLSPAERARCNERFGLEAARAPVLDGISPRKRAGFDRSAQGQDEDRRYRQTTQDGTLGGGHPTDPGGIASGPASSLIFKHNGGDPIIPGDPH